jgi:hypothetical protein
LSLGVSGSLSIIKHPANNYFPKKIENNLFVFPGEYASFGLSAKKILRKAAPAVDLLKSVVMMLAYNPPNSLKG